MNFVKLLKNDCIGPKLECSLSKNEHSHYACSIMKTGQWNEENFVENVPKRTWGH
jgi:hypothetical protein